MRAGKVLQERVRGVLQGGSLAAIENDPISNYAEGPVVYWMSRDQRSEDNWALLFARDLAAAGNVPLVTVFNLVPSFLEATERQYDFMLKGLQETERNLREKNISFYLLRGQPRHTVPLFVLSRKASALVTDFSPLRIAKDWLKQVRHQIDSLPMFVVDAHNCIPVWEASDKQESAARTFRAKAKKLEGKFLTEFPDLQPNEAQFPLSPPVDWSDVFQSLQIDRTVKPVDWVVPGSEAGNKVLNKFCTEKLKAYSNKRNNPTVDALSNLSPYFHFGQLAPHRAIMEVKKYAAAHKDCAYSARKWIDETFIFHELTDNYCFYNDNYDNINGAPVWARDTLVAHNKDPREYVYSLQEFENGKTHSQFWNAMQMQLVKEGKLHAVSQMKPSQFKLNLDSGAGCNGQKGF